MSVPCTLLVGKKGNSTNLYRFSINRRSQIVIHRKKQHLLIQSTEMNRNVEMDSIKIIVTRNSTAL